MSIRSVASSQKIFTRYSCNTLKESEETWDKRVEQNLSFIRKQYCNNIYSKRRDEVSLAKDGLRLRRNLSQLQPGSNMSAYVNIHWTCCLLLQAEREKVLVKTKQKTVLIFLTCREGERWDAPCNRFSPCLFSPLSKLQIEDVYVEAPVIL